jgi:hypothetical protein
MVISVAVVKEAIKNQKGFTLYLVDETMAVIDPAGPTTR